MLQQAYDYLVKDPTLKNLVETCPLTPLESSKDSMPSHLIRSIISQQLSTKAAATIYGRFIDLFDDKYLDLNKLLVLKDEVLRSVGLSYSKISYVKNVASYFTEQSRSEIDWNTWDDASIINELTKIKGVGTWTVQMILIFKLNRPDVMPIDDLIVRKGLMQILNISESTKSFKTQLLEKSKSWHPHRSYVSRLMWKAKELKLLDL